MKVLYLGSNFSAILEEMELQVHPFDWTLQDKGSSEETPSIRAWCLDRNSVPHLLRIENYLPTCYIQLPTVVNGSFFEWNSTRAYSVIGSIKYWLKESQPLGANFLYKPLLYDFEPLLRDQIWPYDPTKDDPYIKYPTCQYPFIYLTFRNLADLNECKKLFRRPLKTRDFNQLNCQIWEHEIDLIQKLLVNQNICHNSWISAVGCQVPPNEKISTLAEEYMVDYQSIKPMTPEQIKGWVTQPKILSWDIECNSHNHKAFPDKYDSRDVITLITVIVQRQGKRETRKKYSLILGACLLPIKDCECLLFDNEIDLINAFCGLVRREDPDVITGYNILGFDYSYVNERLSQIGIEFWPSIGRIANKKLKLKTSSWKSGAYGYVHNYILPMDGRIIIDMLPIVKRDYKLDKYGLGQVSQYFLKKTKHDVSPLEMFETYDLLKLALGPTLDVPVPLELDENDVFKSKDMVPPIINLIQSNLHSMQHKFDQRFPGAQQAQLKRDLWSIVENYVEGTSSILEDNFTLPVGKEPTLMDSLVAPTYYNDAFNSDHRLQPSASFIYSTLKKVKRFVEYGIQDSELVIELFEFLNIWIYLIELSNIVGVSIMDTFTRGQQVRCYALVYRDASNRGYVMNFRPGLGIKYEGGLVQNPVVGYHVNIPCEDFSSLYPSIMIAHNLCYTTFVPPEMDHLVPDDLCYVFEFDQMEYPTKKGDDENLGEEAEGDPDKEDKDEDAGLIEGLEGLDNVKQKKTKKKKKEVVGQLVHRRFKFVRKNVRQGILPNLLDRIISRRNAVKVQLAAEKDPVMKVVYDKRQLALKLVANSMYGFCGVANRGRLPHNQLAMCVTYKGRESITKVVNYLKDKYNARIIYGDTDSVMVDLGIKDPSKANEIGRKLADEITNELFADLKPMRLEFEKSMNIIAIRKKGYVAALINDKGEANLNPDKILKRGVIPARRDNCPLAREIYMAVVLNIFKGRSYIETFDLISTYLGDLIEGRVDYKKLLVIKQLGANYKSETFPMKVFADNLRRLGKHVQAGDRLDYLIMEQLPDQNGKFAKSGYLANMGHRMMLPEDYLSQTGSNIRKVDYLYYIAHQLMNPIDQLFEVGYRQHYAFFQTITYRPSTRHKPVPINSPIELMSKMLMMATREGRQLTGHLLDPARQLIRSIDVSDLESPTTPINPILNNNNGNGNDNNEIDFDEVILSPSVTQVINQCPRFIVFNR